MSALLILAAALFLVACGDDIHPAADAGYHGPIVNVGEPVPPGPVEYPSGPTCSGVDAGMPDAPTCEGDHDDDDDRDDRCDEDHR